MRLAIISPGYAPTLGGVEVVVTATAERLAALGVDVEVWAQQRGVSEVITEVRNGVTVRRFPATASVRFSISTALWRHIRRHAREFDVVHAHSYHSAAALPVAFARGLPPVVFSPHYHGTGHTALATMAHLPYRQVGLRIMRRAAAIVAVSEAEAGLIRRDFATEAAGKVTVVHNAVDSAALAAAEPRPDEPPTVLVLGRIEQYKRIDTVIDAFAAAEVVPGQLVIIGDGPERAALQARAAHSAAADRVRFLGRLEDADVQRWLRTARVVVSLSEKEAFGLVGMEGVAAGAVALLSDIPAHREVAGLLPVDRVFLAAASPGGLSRQLGELVATPNEPRPVRDWNTAAAEQLAVYQSVVDPPPAA